jgi:integrase
MLKGGGSRQKACLSWIRPRVHSLIFCEYYISPGLDLHRKDHSTHINLYRIRNRAARRSGRFGCPHSLRSGPTLTYQTAVN